ncbi:MAG: 5'/3'-nucleotidase SurE [Ardenticatenales bacterium]|nr:5'/3'-nucleotidase SurE [Ardenticatenales bacterium]
MTPIILLTNDDGIFSPGLKAAAAAVAHLGELLIVAPRYQQTSMGRAMPRDPKTGIVEAIELDINGQAVIGYGVHGSPAQAVLHAVMERAPEKPALCISGINYGENLGVSITLSGTVGAAIEATSWGIPAMALSLEFDVDSQHSNEYHTLDWEGSKHVTAYLAERLLRQGLPPEISMLNVNIPSDTTASTLIRVTTQSRQNYFVIRQHGGRDFSQSHHYDFDVLVDDASLEPESDVMAVWRDRVVSVTPLGWEMTAKIHLEEWFSRFDLPSGG